MSLLSDHWITPPSHPKLQYRHQRTRTTIWSLDSVTASTVPLPSGWTYEFMPRRQLRHSNIIIFKTHQQLSILTLSFPSHRSPLPSPISADHPSSKYAFFASF
jgi:hypothetical protein